MSDLIDRQDAIDLIMSEPTDVHYPSWFAEILKKKPSAEPERKKGKWIGKEQFANSPEFYSWQCSVCGCVLEDPTLDKPYPFCPNCGSFNGEGEQE